MTRQLKSNEFRSNDFIPTSPTGEFCGRKFCGRKFSGRQRRRNPWPAPAGSELHGLRTRARALG